MQNQVIPNGSKVDTEYGGYLKFLTVVLQINIFVIKKILWVMKI